MIVLTSIYNAQHTGVIEFLKSCDRLGLTIHNASVGHKVGYGAMMRELYEALKVINDEQVVYSDGGDTYFMRRLPNVDEVIYSTEKNCYPEPKLALEYPNPKSAWCFLNGGNWVAPRVLMIEFIEKYKLHKLPNNANCQLELAIAYLDAVKKGFPIKLDEECKFFQTLWAAFPGDFGYKDKRFFNLKTRTEPCVIHGNGGSDIQTIYNMF